MRHTSSHMASVSSLAASFQSFPAGHGPTETAGPGLATLQPELLLPAASFFDVFCRGARRRRPHGAKWLAASKLKLESASAWGFTAFASLL